MQIEILSSEAIMMTSWVNWGSNETWNHISNSYSIQIWEQFGGSVDFLKSYNGFCIGMFLPIYAMYYKISRVRTCILNGR